MSKPGRGAFWASANIRRCVCDDASEGQTPGVHEYASLWPLLVRQDSEGPTGEVILQEMDTFRKWHLSHMLATNMGVRERRQSPRGGTTFRRCTQTMNGTHSLETVSQNEKWSVSESRKVPCIVAEARLSQSGDGRARHGYISNRTSRVQNLQR